MSDEILVNATSMEVRVAMIENGMLQEVIIERGQKRGLVGNIYRGKVTRVLPGMQAAFIDIGLNKAAFVHAADVDLKNNEAKSAPNNIRDLLHEGQNITVQIVKDPIGSKGAKVTAFLSLSSRYLVYMPDMAQLGVSQRIDDEQERERLKRCVNQLMSDRFVDVKGSFIIRTAAEDTDKQRIENDISFLNKLWCSLDFKAKSPRCIYEDLPLFLHILRDNVRDDLERIRVDSREALQKMQDFCGLFMPEKVELLELYLGGRPIFELYHVDEDIQKALSRKVELQSGGSIVIDQTEAMTTIDVNTGGFVGHRNLEETLFKTNLEAAKALARQIRVRNLGGIIIVDFIDMQDEEHKLQVHRTLKKALAKDFIRTAITGVTELGLVQIVRKRTRESLKQVLSEDCAVCHGTGKVKSAETVCYEIFRAILREARTDEHGAYLVLASGLVVDRLLDEESTNVADLEAFIDKTLKFQIEPAYTQQQFDVVLL